MEDLDVQIELIWNKISNKTIKLIESCLGYINVLPRIHFKFLRFIVSLLKLCFMCMFYDFM